MSRIGKIPVEIPDGVSVEIAGVMVTVKGKHGELSATFTDDVEITQRVDQVLVSPKSDSPNARKMWGTSRSVISDLVAGVNEGFTKNLEINGVGYRAQVQGKELVLQLGFSHDGSFLFLMALISSVLTRPMLRSQVPINKKLVRWPP